MKKNKTLIISSGVVYAILITLVAIFIFAPGFGKIKESNLIKELTYEEKTKLIDEINKEYTVLVNDVNAKYEPSISSINKKYDDLSDEVKDKYSKSEKEIEDLIVNNKAAQNKEFFANGFSKKYYELGNKYNELQNQKNDLSSKKRNELKTVENNRKAEIDSIENNKVSELNRLNNKKTNEINVINNQNYNKTSIKINGILRIIIGVIIIIIPVLYIVKVYNELTSLLNSVKEKWSQIDVLLKQRADLIPNIVETVKGYAKHERGTFMGVTKARNQVMNASTKEEEIETNKNLSNQLAKLLFLQENYPELKANDNFIGLQDNLREIEDDISLYRQQYNSSVLKYKNKLEMFPSNIVADLFNFKPELFFEIEEDEKENPNISL